MSVNIRFAKTIALDMVPASRTTIWVAVNSSVRVFVKTDIQGNLAILEHVQHYVIKMDYASKPFAFVLLVSSVPIAPYPSILPRRVP